MLWFALLACTSESSVDTSRWDDTDTGEAGGLSAFVPPSWFREAPYSIVEPHRGLHWTVDATFHLEGYSVPHVFVAPGGRFGMLATNMKDVDQMKARSILWSDDGRTWEEGGALMWVADVPYPCGDRLEDATLWREDADTWTFVFEGTEFVPGGGFSTEPRQLCPGSTSDLQSWRWDAAPMWAGAFPEDRISVPTAITFEREGGFLFYNGDIMGKSQEGSGIRIARLERDPHAVVPWQTTPILRWQAVDPDPVYLKDGGVRLYFAQFHGEAGEAGLRAVDLDDQLLPVGEDQILLPSPGKCKGDPYVGECYYDPMFVGMPDGTLYLYFSDITYDEGGGIHAAVGRAVATD